MSQSDRMKDDTQDWAPGVAEYELGPGLRAYMAVLAGLIRGQTPAASPATAAAPAKPAPGP